MRATTAAPSSSVRNAGRLPSAAETVQVHLPKGSLVRSRGGFALHVLKGRLWITRSGELDDTFVSSGERFDLPAGSQAVIEADHEAQVALGPLGARAVRQGQKPRFTIAPHCWSAV